MDESGAEMLARLAHLAEYRDDQTGHHASRVGLIASGIARNLGLDGDQVALVRWAAPLHDVGKIVIPDRILHKPSALTPHEYEMTKTHTTTGAEILSRGRSPVLRMAAEIALAHHEWWDGRGYPCKLKGKEIPLPARIVAVADAFEAMVGSRRFRKARPVEEAIREIHRCSGTQFDPGLVGALGEPFPVLRWIGILFYQPA